MNNFEKFYKISGNAIEIFSNAIKKQNDNFEHEKKKVLQKIKDYSDKEKLEFVFTWQFLIDYALLCLNKEKVENDVTLNWDNYKPQIFSEKGYFLADNNVYTKIAFFKDWLSVVDCKEKYLAEDARFWIKRIRNSLLHGNFEYDYENIQKQRINIFEGTANSTDMKMKIIGLGLHEFVQDNFQNIDHEEYGISSSYDDLFIILNERITNREQLVKVLTEKLVLFKRKVDSNYYYDGNDIINSTTGEKVARERKFVKASFVDNKAFLDSREFLNPEIETYVLDNDYIKVLVWVLENKFNIYSNKKQRKAICQAVREYSFPMECINRLLHEFDTFCGAITCDKKDYREVNIDLNKMKAVFYNFGENIENAFIILKLCRAMYRLQNKNFEKINTNLFDSKDYMIVPQFATEEMQKRVDKQKTLITDPDYSEEDKERIARNNAYIETLRNALAHGNIDISFVVKDNKIHSIFKFTDDWTNKRGERQVVELRSTSQLFNEYLDAIDFVAEDYFNPSAIVNSNMKDEGDFVDSTTSV